METVITSFLYTGGVKFTGFHCRENISLKIMCIYIVNVTGKMK